MQAVVNKAFMEMEVMHPFIIGKASHCAFLYLNWDTVESICQMTGKAGLLTKC